MPKPQAAVPTRAGTLLLVESDVLARAVLADYLRGCGYVVHEARAAEEALELVGVALDIDVVLVEVQAVGAMSGFDLAHAIRRHRPEVEVILTASQAMTVEKCHDLCRHRILRKPFTPADLVREIRLLRRRRRPQAPES